MSGAADWSAARYLAFERERTRPVRDLLSVVPREGIGTAVDIGCGPGNSTEVMVEHLPEARIEGLDSSPDMIAAARARLPGVRFDLADIRGWTGADHDLILAKAVLQWLPDHATLLPDLIGRLAPGGWLAVQMPDNLDEPSHRLMREVAAEPDFAAVLAGASAARAPRHELGWYLRLLRPLAAEVVVWRTEYVHLLAGAGAIVDWVRSAGLRPYVDPLDPEAREAFLARYLARIREAYPPLPGGEVALRFPRIFLVARR